MRAWWLLVPLVAACEGRVSEFGEAEPPGGVIRDLSGPQVTAFSCAASQVDTRVDLPCTAEARHPTGEALRCTLDPGDGRAPLALGDCSTATPFTLRYLEPGAVRAILTVTDEAGRLTSRPLALTVTGLPNQPPSIASFTASRGVGVAPLRTTVSWAVSDPEGDALTCALDVGADGTIDETGLDCTSGTTTLELRAVGATSVRLVVTDALGLAADRSITLEVQPPTADVRIEAVQLGQSIVKESLTLVEGKAALLRVIALANEPGLAAPLELEARVGGEIVGRQPLTGPAEVPQSVAPGDLARSYRVELPEAWVRPGLELHLRLDPADALLEADETNNARVVTPTVGRGHELHLTSVPVVTAGVTGTPLDVRAAVTRLWPVQGVEARTRAPLTFEGSISGTSTSGWASLLSAIAQARASDSSARHYYGWLRVSFGSGIAGIGYVGQPASVGRDDSLGTATHELGHNFGQNHAPCGGVAGADPGFPYANGRIGTWGWNGMQLLDPSRYVDLMSYCSPEWVSDYSYERVQRFMANRESFAPGVMLPSVEREPVVLIAGRLAPGGVELAPVQRFLGARTPRVEAAEAVLHLEASDGRLLRVPVELQETSEGDERHFVAVVDDPGELRALTLTLRGVPVARREADTSPFAPVATSARLDAERVLVRWAGAVSALVAHVGAERTTLTVDARRGDVVVHTRNLEGGHLAISLSDGVRSRLIELPMPR
jgi:hypothetical protein